MFDAVIVGAGAAGLSLACHLAHAGWGGNVLLVDDGSRPLEQRSWGWWTTGGGLLDSAASSGVDELVVAGPGWRRRLALAPYTYRTITGPDLSAAADGLLGARPGYQRVRGRVRTVTREGAAGRVTIDLPGSDDARTVEVRARWVFDSVGPGSSPSGPSSSMNLDFLGLHVECTRDTFDPGAPTLMDFRTDQSAGAAFVYVLPTSARTALVERTVFVHQHAYDGDLTPLSHEVHVQDYVRDQLGGGSYRVTGRETGIIPLFRRPPAAAVGSVIPIGARAGMVKASTGYGFARIQRHSAAIAARLTRGRSPAHAAPAHRWHRALDGALLRVVRDDPAGALDVLTTLLTQNPPDRILAFLDEDAQLRSQVQLFATLPLPPFARAQLRTALGPLAPAGRTAARVAGAVFDGSAADPGASNQHCRTGEARDSRREQVGP